MNKYNFITLQFKTSRLWCFKRNILLNYQTVFHHTSYTIIKIKLVIMTKNMDLLPLKTNISQLQ